MKFVTKKKKKGKNDKKSSQSAVIDSPGRSTGNNIFSKGGLVHNACLRTLTDSEVGVGELHGDGVGVPRDLDVGVETERQLLVTPTGYGRCKQTQGLEYNVSLDYMNNKIVSFLSIYRI